LLPIKPRTVFHWQFCVTAKVANDPQEYLAKFGNKNYYESIFLKKIPPEIFANLLGPSVG
jgi:hypothetical protein